MHKLQNWQREENYSDEIYGAYNPLPLGFDKVYYLGVGLAISVDYGDYGKPCEISMRLEWENDRIIFFFSKELN